MSGCGANCYQLATQCQNDWNNYLSNNYSANVYPNAGGSALNITVAATLLSFISLVSARARARNR